MARSRTMIDDYTLTLQTLTDALLVTDDPVAREEILNKIRRLKELKEIMIGAERVRSAQGSDYKLKSTSTQKGRKSWKIEELCVPFDEAQVISWNYSVFEKDVKAGDRPVVQVTGIIRGLIKVGNFSELCLAIEIETPGFDLQEREIYSFHLKSLRDIKYLGKLDAEGKIVK